METFYVAGAHCSPFSRHVSQPRHAAELASKSMSRFIWRQKLSGLLKWRRNRLLDPALEIWGALCLLPRDSFTEPFSERASVQPKVFANWRVGEGGGWPLQARFPPQGDECLPSAPPPSP